MSPEPSLHEAHDPSRPYSIDLSLALERELELEPDSPAPNAPVVPSRAAHRQSLDPHVVESIITGLRGELAKEREDRVKLEESLAVALNNEGQLQSTLSDMTEKCGGLQEELEGWRQKSRDDDEAITLLRSKVEESRRGLMRLQSESRRTSLAVNVDAASKKSKRQSMNFTPMTGSGFSMPSSSGGRGGMHRSTSSVSDASYIMAGEPKSPSAQSFTFTEQMPPPSSRRFSGLFGRPANVSPPPDNGGGLSRSRSPQPFDLPTDPAELDSLRTQLEVLNRQVVAAKEALEETRNELTESNEAREASETCVNALREFIAENGVGERKQDSEEVKLPPLPEQTTGEEEVTPTAKKAAGGWGFKLWGQSATTMTHVPRISTSSLPRSSLSSIHSASSATTPGPLPMSHALSQSSSSETSSFDESEPVSPASVHRGVHISPQILHDGMVAEDDVLLEAKTPVVATRQTIVL